MSRYARIVCELAPRAWTKQPRKYASTNDSSAAVPTLVALIELADDRMDVLANNVARTRSLTF